MTNETPFHVVTSIPLPMSLPELRLEHVEYSGLVEIEEIPGSNGELYFCHEANEVFQHVGEHLIVVKFD